MRSPNAEKAKTTNRKYTAYRNSDAQPNRRSTDLLPKATTTPIASINASVPTIGGAPVIDATTSPAAAPNTASTSTMKTKYATSNTTQPRPTSWLKKAR